MVTRNVTSFLKIDTLLLLLVFCTVNGVLLKSKQPVLPTMTNNCYK